MNLKPVRLLVPALALVALSACSSGRDDEVAYATSTDLQTVNTRVQTLEQQVQDARQAADRAQQAAERAQQAAERIEELYRQGQRK
ncbi:alanine-zipper protein [Indioceanicola profundi]|uniref:alanine-zipper protein n=1 Tax=Indioceanicola profundi TaxID=2220096 RepID=UPI000E6AD819|nr:alanine-zipper protein [Indioceanicola profundi]